MAAVGFDPTGNDAVRSAVPEKNPPYIQTWRGRIGWRVAELWPFEILQNVWIGREVGRRSSIFILLTLVLYPLSLRS